MREERKDEKVIRGEGNKEKVIREGKKENGMREERNEEKGMREDRNEEKWMKKKEWEKKGMKKRNEEEWRQSPPNGRMTLYFARVEQTLQDCGKQEHLESMPAQGAVHFGEMSSFVEKNKQN